MARAHGAETRAPCRLSLGWSAPSLLVSFEEVFLLLGFGDGPLGQPLQFGPTLHQGVVRQGLLGPLLALAEGVEAVAELPGDLGPGTETLDNDCRGHITASLEDPNQLVDDFPD